MTPQANHPVTNGLDEGRVVADDENAGTGRSPIAQVLGQVSDAGDIEVVGRLVVIKLNCLRDVR